MRQEWCALPQTATARWSWHVRVPPTALRERPPRHGISSRSSSKVAARASLSLPAARVSQKARQQSRRRGAEEASGADVRYEALRNAAKQASFKVSCGGHRCSGLVWRSPLDGRRKRKVQDISTAQIPNRKIECCRALKRDAFSASFVRRPPAAGAPRRGRCCSSRTRGAARPPGAIVRCTPTAPRSSRRCNTGQAASACAADAQSAGE